MYLSLRCERQDFWFSLNKNASHACTLLYMRFYTLYAKKFEKQLLFCFSCVHPFTGSPCLGFAFSKKYVLLYLILKKTQCIISKFVSVKF